MRLSHFSVVLFSAGIAVHCGKVSYDTPPNRYTGPENRCTTDAECGKGYACDDDLFACVFSGGEQARSMYIRIHPDNLMPQAFPLDIAPSKTSTLQLPSPKNLVAEVQTDDSGFVAPARIFIVDQEVIPGSPPETTYAAVAEAGTLTRAYLTLFEGYRRYRVEVISNDAADIPPTYLDNVSVVADRGLSNDGHFQDENGEEIEKFQLTNGTMPYNGRIERGSQPVDGLSVVMIDPEDGRILSTRGTTGCGDGTVCGKFELRTSLQNQAYALKIWKASDQEYPVVTVPDTAVVTESSVTPENHVVTLPALPSPVRFGAVVERTVRIESSDEPVHDRAADCTVIFESEKRGENGEIETIYVSAKTDDTGNIVSLTGTGPSLYLYPGKYRITIVPPIVEASVNEDYAVHVEDDRQIDLSPENQVFILNYRYFARFRITGGGRDMPGAQVEAYPLDPLSPHTPISYSVAMPDGTHKIWLDPGRYRLVARAPYESRYAYAVREVSFEDDDRLSKAPIEVSLDDFALPLPLLSRLHIDSDEVSLQGATVEWYEQTSNSGAYAVARSAVDENGDTTGFLPPR